MTHGYHPGMNTTSTGSDGRTLRHQHRRPELLARITEFVLEKGTLDWSLRQAAEAVGVTHATLLRHFESKDLLLVEIVDKIRLDLLARIETHFADGPSNGSIADELRRLWRLLCEPAERRQFALLFALIAARRGEGDPLGRSATLLVEDFLSPLADGHSPARARTLATSVLAQIRGLQLDLAVTADQDRVDDALDLFADKVCGGYSGALGEVGTPLPAQEADQ